MTPKIKKPKVLIPKGVKLRKCFVRLGQINKLLSTGIHSVKRKTYGGPFRSFIPSQPPPPSLTKLIRVKSDLFRKASTTPLSGQSERASKRTPKPNRRYVNDETVITTSNWNDKDSEDQSDSEDDSVVNVRQKSPQTEPTRRPRITVSAPRTDAAAGKKGLPEKLTLMKRKIDYDSDEKSASKQQKMATSESDTDEDDSEPVPTRKQRTTVKTTSPKSAAISPKTTSKTVALKPVNSRARPLIKLPQTTKQKSSPIRTTPINSNKQSKPKEASPISAPKGISPISKPNVVVDLEDFEQMPTFTIVNINDIINQKEEVVVIEKSPTVPGKKVKKITTKNTDKSKAEEEKSDPVEPDDLIADLIDDDVDGKVNKSVNESRTLSRRKTPHKVLSDQLVQSSTTNTAKPIVSKSPAAVSAKPYRNIIGGKNNGKLKNVDSPLKPPPRILNSQLCTNAKSDLTSVVAKITSPKKTLNNNIKAVLNRSKENMKTQEKPVTHVTTISGGRKVRKMTCFETWFVIKLPNIEPTVSKSILDMELIKLGNEIKEIPLPTPDWNYKITLSRLTKPNPNGLIYSGEVQDADVKEEEKHFYQPTTIMFRRECKNKALRMQFDRAVIMKNRNFFINVDGKNVKLIGAPQFVQNFEDIETLLQIVENVTLRADSICYLTNAFSITRRSFKFLT